MPALCAAYQLRPVGLAINAIQRSMVGDDGSPSRPPEGATASHPSRQPLIYPSPPGLPGGGVASIG